MGETPQGLIFGIILSAVLTQKILRLRIILTDIKSSVLAVGKDGLLLKPKAQSLNQKLKSLITVTVQYTMLKAEKAM